jgi:hypothetical protein
VERYRRATLFSVTSALLALAPKCPVCFLAYFGIFGVTAASASAYRAWLPVITAIWLAATVGILGLRDSHQRKSGPLRLGIFAALAVFAGRFIFDFAVLLYGGLLMLLAAVVWRSWRSRTARGEACAICESAHHESAGLKIPSRRTALNKP